MRTIYNLKYGKHYWISHQYEFAGCFIEFFLIPYLIVKLIVGKPKKRQ
jgi:hypothetical protein